MVGLSGKVFFSHGKRKEFSLDMIQLTESGVKTAGEWDSKTGLNATCKPAVIKRPDYSTTRDTCMIIK